MKFSVRVPKDSIIENFSLYVIGEFGDEYGKLTTTEQIEFEPSELIIQITNQDALEKELNGLPTRLWHFEHLQQKCQILLDSLNREESIYNSQRYNNLATLSDKKFKTEGEKNNYLLGNAIHDKVMEKLWGYVGKSKKDVEELTICVKALRSQLFKCKDFYQTHYSAKKGSSDSF